MLDLFSQQYVLFCLIGVMAGILSGLFGIGGGLVLVPMLSALFVAHGWTPELAYHSALATSMACIVFTAISSIVAHHRHGNIIWRYVWLMVPMAFIASLLATLWVVHISAVYLSAIFAIFTFYAAINLFQDSKPAFGKKPSEPELRLVAFGIGLVSALVSIGGGTLTVPYLTLRNVAMKQAIGTSAVLGLPIAIASTLSYVWDALHNAHGLPDSVGYLYLPAIALITPCSVLMAPVGVALTRRLPVKMLKRIFALFLLLVTVKLVSGLWVS